MIMSRNPHSAFTLIELLIVIAIVAVLAVVVILVINPGELLRQARDSNRLSDLATVNEALGIFLVNNTSLGVASTTYISIPDPSATSTAGDQCQGLSLPGLPSGWSYHCASPASYKNVDGTGWLPVHFRGISSGSPISNLPVDPQNQSSTNFYYTYTTDGTKYELTSMLESSKYKATVVKNPLITNFP